MASSLFMPSRVPYFAVLLFCALAVVLECLHHCLTAQNLCRDESTCNHLYYFVNENCGNYSASDVCTAKDALSCKATLKALQIHKIFQSPCICTDETSNLEEQCHEIFNYIFKNPCLKVSEKASSAELQIQAEEDDLRAPSCTYAFKICSENERCKQIYEYFKRYCRVIDNVCRPINRGKCEDAVAGIQFTPMYACSCWNSDDKCRKIHQLINNNSCIGEFSALSEARFPPFKINELWNDNPPSLSPSTTEKFPSENMILSVFSQSDTSERQVEKPPTFHENQIDPSITPRDSSEENKTPSSSTVIVSSNDELPNVLPDSKRRAERVTLPPQDSAHITIVTSTCTWAQETCQETSACHLLLENVFLACDDNGASCNRTNCLAAIRNFYHLGNPDKTFDVAFCNCRQDDSACFLSQRRMHPACAITVPSHMPGCDEIAESCMRREDCKHRLQRFVDACAVNRSTFLCQSSPRACQEALVGILGTPLRTVCGCSGNNIISLYKCTDWQRTVWLNPCVVQAQREFLDDRSNRISQVARTAMKLEPLPYTPKPHLAENKDFSSNSSPQGQNALGTMPTYAVPTKISPPQPATQYCNLTGKGPDPLKIRYGTGRRVYSREDPDCSSICMCDFKGDMDCRVLPCTDARISCQTSNAVYSHSQPAFQAYRGQCICYSGKFICVKPSPQLYSLRQGIFLFLGYSELEERLLSPVTQMNIANSIKRLQEVVNEVQGKTSGKLCKLETYKHIGENIVMQAFMEEFESARKNNSMAKSMVLKEKDYCYHSLITLSAMINSHNSTIRDDVSMSLFKLSKVEVHVTEPTNGCLTISSLQTLKYLIFASLAFLVTVSPAYL